MSKLQRILFLKLDKNCTSLRLGFTWVCYWKR